MLHLAVAIIPFMLWIPPSRRLTDICTTVAPLLHNNRIDRIRSRLIRILLVLRARLQSRHTNFSHGLHELSLQQLAILVL